MAVDAQRTCLYLTWWRCDQPTRARRLRGVAAEHHAAGDEASDHIGGT
jgi:hypothetical protein